MASNDYDDLLESFMNNSQKVYNEDKNKQEKTLPSSYNTYSKDDTKKTRDKRSAKQPPKHKKQKSPAEKALAGLGKVLLGILMVCGVVGIVCVSVMAVYGYNVVHGDPVFDLKNEATSQNQTSFIYAYDDDGKLVEITRLHGEENRIWLDASDMNEYMSKAVVAIEDERFEKHHGVDWKRTIGVIVKPSNAGQGGSTITQQLIKNLTDQNDVTFVRKFNEILSALNLEKHYSKDEIMEAYLNTLYLSHGCYGVKTAAETYFGKDVKDLNIAECATLAGITQKPTYYDPLLNPENNKTKQERILLKMYKQGYITKSEYDEAVNYKLVFTNSKDYKGSKVSSSSKKSTKNKVNSYYTDFVIDQVITDLQKNGYSAKKARNMIYGGGLKIYTAVDLDVQNAIEDVYVNRKKMPDDTVQGACVVMDYKGRILGMVGGTGKKTANRVLNRAWQSKRQPGSSIKPISVYGPALQKSLDDDDTDIFWTSPVKDVPLTKINGKPFPTNDGGSYSGRTVSLQYGLAHSMNTISAQTLDKIGIDYSFDFITNRFHISTLEPYDCDLAPMATGSVTYGVTVLEMTTAYQAYGNGGYYYEGYSYYKIEDSQGNVLIEKVPESTKESAVSEETGWLMNKMMQTVCTQGTGRSFKISGVECFGKTGTTSDNKDKWFIAGTPEYMCGVWYGYDDNKTIHYYYSSNPAGTMWNQVLNGIYQRKGIKKREFPECDGLVRKSYNGSTGWFDKNNLPKGKAAVTGVGGAVAKRTTKKAKYKDKDKSTTDKTGTTKTGESTTGGDNDNTDTTAAESTTSAPESTTKASDTGEEDSTGGDVDSDDNED